jgi:poly(hydroxyalkanoate) depolymerase family esterase
MKALMREEMVEATRLTRAGRLSEAVALIQSLLRGPADPAPEPARDTAIALPPPQLELTPVDGDVAIHPAGLDGFPAFEPMGETPLALKGLALRLPGRKAPSRSEIAPGAGQYIAATFSFAAGPHSYKLYIPSRLGGGPRPLIVMLHGCTQSADDFAAGTRMNFAAEEKGCFVLYPEQSLSANAQKCWNWFKPADQQRGRGEPALIAAMTRHVMRTHPIDARRVYIAGLSAGGAAAAIMAEAYPDLYAAVAVHSGLACGAARDLPSAFAAMRGSGPAGSAARPGSRTLIPTIVFHGDQDKTVHPCNGTEVIARAGFRGHWETVSATGSPRGRKYTRSVLRDATGRTVLEKWEILGGVHAWSGGSRAGSFTDPAGPDATAHMVEVFLRHEMAPAGETGSKS